MKFVPPETATRNCVLVATFTEVVAGEIVTVIPVTGSVHEEEEVVVEVVEVVVVHTTAVLTGAAYLWHEIRLNRLIMSAKTGRRFTAPLSLASCMPIYCGSVATLLQKRQIISHHAIRNLFSLASSHLAHGGGSRKATHALDYLREDISGARTA
jgi:hypothetical protein